MRATDIDSVRTKGRRVVKVGGKQIALFSTGGGDGNTPQIRACNNRCPHEGYPLIEGTLSEDQGTGACLLTCNWHNWKFDLEDGETLVGGDKLRLYPVRIEDNDIFVDISDPPPEEQINAALGNIEDAMRRHEYDRIAREVARLTKAGGNPATAISRAVAYSHDRFEYGMTHAYAVTADWIALGENLARTEAEKLAPYVEIIGHMSWDSIQREQYPFTDTSHPYSEQELQDAIESEEEDEAIALINGALDAGLDLDDLKPVLARAALAHYQDFGHSIIYVYKILQMSQRLDRTALRPLLHSLVRRLILATREDLIPEFKSYRPVFEGWADGGTTDPADAQDYTTLSVTKVLRKIAESAQHGSNLYPVLLEAAALQFLRYRTEMDHRVDNSVSDNVGWLDFTHAITFANAGRWAAEQDPDLWPAVLLQIGCFLGRNSGFLNQDVVTEDWEIEGDHDQYLNTVLHSLLDHEFPEYIVSCHYVKLTTAIQDEIRDNPEAGFGPVLTAGLNRMLAHPIKRKQILRTATQSLDFVAREG